MRWHCHRKSTQRGAERAARNDGEEPCSGRSGLGGGSNPQDGLRGFRDTAWLAPEVTRGLDIASLRFCGG